MTDSGPTPRDLADHHLVARLRRRRDEPAARELVRRYQRPVFSLLYRMVRDREVAEDLAQETFVKALNALATYRAEYKFSSWVFKIAHNTAIDYLRRREPHTLSLEGSPYPPTADSGEATTFQISTSAESPLDTVTARELGAQIEAAINRLRPEYRSCILLRHVEGLAYEEIATILGLPLGTVKTYIHRARHELRAALAHLRD